MKNNILKRIASISLLVTTLTVTISLPFTSMTTHATENTATAAESTQEQAAWPEDPAIEAGNAILIDADTGAILYQKDANKRCFPASTTKILTGLLTIENCNMDEIVTFSNAAATSYKWDEANLGTKTGEQYTVEQALYGLLLRSANEVAFGLAEHVAGSVPAFVDMMNARAKELGAKNTHFANASGLFDANHYTTPYDLALIARACYNNSTFVSIDSTYTQYTIPPTNVTPTPRTLTHRLQMLKNQPYYYEYCKGGKTGFTDESKYTLVTFAEKNDMRLIAVIMNGDEPQRYIDTRNLFEWGFNNFKKVITTNDTLTSILSNSNYYHSDVFSKNSLFFKLDVSSLTIPNDASVGNVKIQADDDSEASDENGVYTTKLNFAYQNNIVGTADLAISDKNNVNGDINLPFIDSSQTTDNLKPKKCLVINVWIVGAALIILIIAYYVIMDVQRTKHRRRRRYKSRRNIRF